jgi:hypothetical protein
VPKPRPPRADPLPTEVSGSDLRPGTQTYQRTLDHDGNVKFREDCYLLHEASNEGSCKRSGMHFKTATGHNVCYWVGATVWVKFDMPRPVQTRKVTLHNV